MENQNINVNVEEQTIVEETKTNEDVKEVKTFTQEEVNAILEKRLSNNNLTTLQRIIYII